MDDFPPELRPWLPIFNVDARGMGIRICATRGAGKSRLLGRLLAYCDLLTGYPLIVLDPVGAVADNLIDAILRESRTYQKRLWPRIRYVNMAGHRVDGETYVSPFPLLYRSGSESLYTVAQRFLDVIRRLRPALESASIYGWPAVAEVGERALMALFAMGYQITEAEALLADPLRFERALRAAGTADPEALPAVAYFLPGGDYPTSAKERATLTSSFRRMISLFALDPVVRAQYGASSPAITLPQILDDRLCVILDYRDVTNKEQKDLGIRWMYKYVTDYFRTRGPGRQLPISFVIDEISYLLPAKKAKNDLLTEDLQELVQRIARNNSVFVTVAHQELGQFDDPTNEVLHAIGTQILGATADMEGAKQVAERFFAYEPYKIKEKVPQYMSDRSGAYVIDERNVYFTAQEQILEHARTFLTLPAFSFLVGIAAREGQLPAALQLLSLADYQRDQFPRRAATDRVRDHLAREHGQTVSAILAEIAARTNRAASAPPPEVHSEGRENDRVASQSRRRRSEPVARPMTQSGSISPEEKEM